MREQQEELVGGVFARDLAGHDGGAQGDEDQDDLEDRPVERIVGVRRDEAPTRTGTPLIQWDERHGLVKVNPLAAWTDADLATYAAIHEVPLNPLLDQGYPSIGCVPCTRKPAEGEHARAGRWSAHAKTECGLHL